MTRWQRLTRRAGDLVSTASRRLTWRRLEQLCLVLFLCGKAWQLKKRWGVLYGFDSRDQIEVTNLLSWGHLNLGLKQCFNCYQPPLGFLMPKVPLALGMSDTNAGIVTSFACYLVAFFVLRATLSYLGLLARPVAIVFLYLTVAIPLNTYLAFALNLDTPLYAWAAGVLYASVRVFWTTHLPPGRGRRKPLWAAVLVVLLATVPLVKISGFTLCSIPPVVALVQKGPRGWRAWLRRLAPTVLPGVLAVALVAPYFYTRFYKQTGHFLVMNHDWRFVSEVEDGKKWRDEHPVRFFVEMLKPNPGAEQDPNVVDQQRVRLHDWWRFYWLRSQVIGFPGEEQYRISRVYLWLSPYVTALGAWAFWKRRKMGTRWIRLGWVFVLEGAVQMASMIRYFWIYPDAMHIPVKPQYISPFLWTLCYALAGVVLLRGAFPWSLARRWRLARQLLALLVVYWGIFNDLKEIY